MAEAVIPMSDQVAAMEQLVEVADRRCRDMRDLSPRAQALMIRNRTALRSILATLRWASAFGLRGWAPDAPVGGVERFS